MKVNGNLYKMVFILIESCIILLFCSRDIDDENKYTWTLFTNGDEKKICWLPFWWTAAWEGSESVREDRYENLIVNGGEWNKMCKRTDIWMVSLIRVRERLNQIVWYVRFALLAPKVPVKSYVFLCFCWGCENKWLKMWVHGGYVFLICKCKLLTTIHAI